MLQAYPSNNTIFNVKGALSIWCIVRCRAIGRPVSQLNQDRLVDRSRKSIPFPRDPLVPAPQAGHLHEHFAGQPTYGIWPTETRNMMVSNICLLLREIRESTTQIPLRDGSRSPSFKSSLPGKHSVKSSSPNISEVTEVILRCDVDLLFHFQF